jgi:tryptophan-rich sensory protein
MYMKRKNMFLLAACIIICELAGAIGAAFTAPAIGTWYAGLQKPAFTPPSWLFGPVWTILYALMGVSLFLVLRRPSGLLESVGVSRNRSGWAQAAFVAQFVLNILWSYLFFGLRNPGLGLIDIVLMWLAILATIVLFWRLSRPAALLLVPYAIWVAFAGCLNYAIWQMNKAIPADGVSCTMEAKLCPDGSYVGRVGPDCQFRPCPGEGGAALPSGYTLDSYAVEKAFPTPCVQNSECVTPPEYLIQSRCPFTSLCLQNRCSVVCPLRKDIEWGAAEALIRECRVSELMRAHSGQVTLYVKGGKPLSAVEPENADIVGLAVQMRPVCGDITIAIE